MEEYDYIGNYFNGLLSPEEMKKFDERVREDPAFAEDVAFYCSSMQEIKRQLAEEKKTRFRELYELQGSDKISRPPVVYMYKWWKAVAAAAVIAGIIFGLFIFTKPSSVELANLYIHQHFETLPVTMSIREDNMQKALRLYNDQNFSAALMQLENILQSDTTNFTAKKYAGIVCLRMKQYDKALDYFKQLEKYISTYSNPAKLYQSLTLIKRNGPDDQQMAKQLLQQIVNSDLEGKEEAAVLLKKL